MVERACAPSRAAVGTSERRPVTAWGSNSGLDPPLALLKEGFAPTTCTQLESGVAAQLVKSFEHPASLASPTEAP